jgi:hypothetical protein
MEFSEVKHTIWIVISSSAMTYVATVTTQMTTQPMLMLPQAPAKLPTSSFVPPMSSTTTASSTALLTFAPAPNAAIANLMKTTEFPVMAHTPIV